MFLAAYENSIAFNSFFHFYTFISWTMAYAILPTLLILSSLRICFHILTSLSKLQIQLNSLLSDLTFNFNSWKNFHYQVPLLRSSTKVHYQVPRPSSTTKFHYLPSVPILNSDWLFPRLFHSNLLLVRSYIVKWIFKKWSRGFVF